MFTGGGTVGHVTPISLIPKFTEDGWEVHYIGDKKESNTKRSKSGLDVRFHSIATGNCAVIFQNMMDVFAAAWERLFIAILLRVRPQVLFSKGGFVSVPPGDRSQTPRASLSISMSPDLSMGLANKIKFINSPPRCTRLWASTWFDKEEISVQ